MTKNVHNEKNYDKNIWYESHDINAEKCAECLRL